MDMYWSLPLKEERAGYLLENLIKALKPYALQLLPDRPIGIEALITSVLASSWTG